MWADEVNDYARGLGIAVMALGDIDLEVADNPAYERLEHVVGIVVPWNKLTCHKRKPLNRAKGRVTKSIELFLSKNRDKIGYIHEILPLGVYPNAAERCYGVGTVISGYIKKRPLCPHCNSHKPGRKRLPCWIARRDGLVCPKQKGE